MTPDIQELKGRAQWLKDYGVKTMICEPSTILALIEENERLREAFSGPAAWLDSWAQHVGNCKGGYVCTCGLTLARTEAAAALKETTDE